MSTVPASVQEVISRFYTWEVATVTRVGQPATWPVLTSYREPTGSSIFSASIAFPVKALNARRNPKVSLLYSDPTGVALDRPPAVLVQGNAMVTELLDYTRPEVLGLFRISTERQPDSGNFSSNRLARSLFDWYLFQRLLVSVEPKRLLIWPEGDFHSSPTEIEVRHVE
jgi:hypothetical protein